MFQSLSPSSGLANNPWPNLFVTKPIPFSFDIKVDFREECLATGPGISYKLFEEKTDMDIQRSLKILELDRTASIDDVTQAYKDIVSVWHPDRFTHNPRLKRKAEEKIKDVNIAYETLKSFYAQRQTQDEGEEGSSRAKEETRNRTEATFEIGTQLVLTAWSYLSSRLRRVVDSQEETGEEAQHRKGKR
jgi:DnaJ-class molecular chaperone